MIEARLDRLPMTRHLWYLVTLLAAGAFFETYDLALTALAAPGLVREGVFATRGGLLGLPDQAAFGAATFLGLFAGALLFGRFADRIGRKRTFNVALLLYTGATVLMALQHSAMEVDVWRFVGGIGLGVELVTIDAYIAEIVPARYRGRAFAFSTFVQLLAVPVAGVLSLTLIPRSPLGVEGWRWLCIIGSGGAMLVWFTRTRLPESPRWLAQHGSVTEADRIVTTLEQRCFGAVAAAKLPHLTAMAGEATEGTPANVAAGVMFRAPWLGIVTMLSLMNVFNAIGFYGFGNWVPALLAAQGHPIMKSLEYSLYIGLSYPVCPLLFLLFADRLERKWQIVIAALGAGACGLCFAHQDAPAMLILFGVGVTMFNVLSAYATHAYQSELFPSAMRAQAIGFVYSWGRLAAVFSSLIMGFLLQRAGTTAAFVFLAVSQIIVAAVVAVMGPRTLKGREAGKTLAGAYR
ncbi:MFS transporter [Paraburkholderia sp. 1N]|uniref:MFS transporter n=2 Tax=Paraburkholderia solitsugae TaxID=2675748 RepID=A0ABX2BT31_9BURK|nr:MFS transporter [Paraburkholderia solitsugae]